MTGYENGAVTCWTPCVICGKHLSCRPGVIDIRICKECKEAVDLVRDNKDALAAIIRIFTETPDVAEIPIPEILKEEEDESIGIDRGSAETDRGPR